MKDDFTKNFVVAVALILSLLGLDRLSTSVKGHGETRRRLVKVLNEMHNGDLNREDFDALAAGYYEGLGNRTTPGGLPVERDDIRLRNDFLLYELKPNLQRRVPDGMRITNSLGMPNPEYTYQKPPRTRRIALLGDSVSLGPYGRDYEALLEARLNQENLTPEVQRFQILNFAVYGYGVVQQMDVALEEAPKFRPDVYMVALTALDANRKGGWNAHIARLWLDRADLKYDLLRRVAVQAGLQPTDHLPAIRRKLAPFYLEVTRWALEQIRDHACSQAAQMVIILVPTPINPDVIAEEFNDIRTVVDSIDVPVIDLRNAFSSSSKNLDALQVDPGIDNHPNARAHQMLFEDLYQKILQNPEFLACLLGTSDVGNKEIECHRNCTGLRERSRVGLSEPEGDSGGSGSAVSIPGAAGRP